MIFCAIVTCWVYHFETPHILQRVIEAPAQTVLLLTDLNVDLIFYCDLQDTTDSTANLKQLF